jgi:hypothetical protein
LLHAIYHFLCIVGNQFYIWQHIIVQNEDNR